MSYVKRDLLLHFDEASGQYSFFAIDAADTASMRDAAGGKLAADGSFFGAAGSAEAEQSLGRLVLTLLDRAYLRAPMHGQSTAAAPPPIVAAGADEYTRFVELQSRAMSEYSSALLVQAEEMLVVAARLGFATAAETLNDWPTVKMVSEKLIARGPQPT